MGRRKENGSQPNRKLQSPEKQRSTTTMQPSKKYTSCSPYQQPPPTQQSSLPPVSLPCVDPWSPSQLPPFHQNLPVANTPYTLPSNVPTYVQQKFYPGHPVFSMPPPPLTLPSAFHTMTVPVPPHNLQCPYQMMILPAISPNISVGVPMAYSSGPLQLVPPHLTYPINVQDPSENILVGGPMDYSPGSMQHSPPYSATSSFKNIPFSAAPCQNPPTRDQLAFPPPPRTAPDRPPNGWPQLSPNTRPTCWFGNCRPACRSQETWNANAPSDVDNGYGHGPADGSPPPSGFYPRPFSRRSHFDDEITRPRHRLASPPRPRRPPPSPHFPRRTTVPVRPSDAMPPAGILAQIDPLVMTSVQLYLLRVVNQQLVNIVEERLTKLFKSGLSERLLRKWEYRLDAVRRDIARFEEEKIRLAVSVNNVAERWKTMLYDLNSDWNTELSVMREGLFDMESERKKFIEGELGIYLLALTYSLIGVQ